MTGASALRIFDLLDGELACPRHRQRFTTVPENDGPRLGVQVVVGLRSPAGLPPASGAPVAWRTVILPFPQPAPLTYPCLRDCEMIDSFNNSKLVWQTYLAGKAGFGTIRLVSEPGRKE